MSVTELLGVETYNSILRVFVRNLLKYLFFVASLTVFQLGLYVLKANTLPLYDSGDYDKQRVLKHYKSNLFLYVEIQS